MFNIFMIAVFVFNFILLSNIIYNFLSFFGYVNATFDRS